MGRIPGGLFFPTLGTAKRTEFDPTSNASDIRDAAVRNIGVQQKIKAKALKQLPGTRNHCKPWSAEDDRILLTALELESGIDEGFAEDLGRSITACRFHLQKLVTNMLLTELDDNEEHVMRARIHRSIGRRSPSQRCSRSSTHPCTGLSSSGRNY